MDSQEAEALYAPAARKVLEAFGVPASELRFISLSENVTFRVTDARDGRSLTLRLHRPGYHDLASLMSERVWVRALAEAGIPAPVPLQSIAGRDYEMIHVEATDEARFASLASWIEGALLSAQVAAEPDRGRVRQYFGELGALMGRLHTQACAWSAPEGFRRRILDADGLMGGEPLWGDFWRHQALTPRQSRLLLSARDRLYGALQRYGTDPSVFSLIHADLHPGNVVITPLGAAVIDFDDAGYGWLLYDLASALYSYQTHEDFHGFRDACLEGYETVRTLPGRARDLLPMFILVRNLAQIGWHHQRPEITTGPAQKRLIEITCTQAAAFAPPL